MKKVLALTGIRSDYDLLSPLHLRLHADPEIELKLLVAGAHLSPTYGHSVDQIVRDGLEILLRVESLLDSNTKAGRLKSAAIFLQGCIDAVAQYNPDLILYAGDREDVMVGALLGGYLEIPTVHFYGGDHAQDGHIDNPIRHAASKLSTVHMVALEAHRQRLLRLGEAAGRIFNVGNIALDRFVSHQAASKDDIRQHFNIAQGFEEWALVIFHPLPEERHDSPRYLANILDALAERGLNAFVSFPNIDPGSRDIIASLERYAQDLRWVFYSNLPREVFLSLYKNSSLLIGNSSSGIAEAASIPLPVVNVGARQRGRFAPPNVLFCGPQPGEIRDALQTACSPDFARLVSGITNPFGDGHSAARAHEILKTHDFRSLLAKTEDPLNTNP